MRRHRESLSDAIGTDAFLDIVANLVGILLILMMVIGVRMEDATRTTEFVTPAPPVAALAPEPVVMPIDVPDVVVPDSDEARLELSRLKRSIRLADEEAQKLTASMNLQKLERDNLMLAVTRAQVELDKRRAALDASQQQNVAQQLAWQTANEAHAQLTEQLNSLNYAASQGHTELLQHVATPIAKTVFVREEHFQLKGGKLLYVPLNAMTNVLRREAPKKMWKLERAQQVTETIGPSEGFEMRYTLRRNRVPIQTESGMSAVREVVELDRFTMVPVGLARGESVSEALSETSSFRSRLSAWNPRETIVTVWTYPDSFGDFRKLKAELYKIGYLTAARPLPANQLISGSPQGTRSAAQ